MTKRGVYFLANNRLSDLTITFLNSFRLYNPDIPLCLIPFNEETDEIIKLKDKYKFTVFENKELLKFCDKVSMSFHGYVLGHYRKLCIWQGEFDEFVYIDIDTVVLDNLDFSFDLLNEFDFITADGNWHGNIKWVWKESIYNANILSQKQYGFAANTGFIVSKKSVVKPEELEIRISKALKIAKYMELTCCEQPLLNYLMVTSGMNYNCLASLAKDEVNYPDLKVTHWSGTKGGEIRDGGKSFYYGKYKILFVHWAGQYQQKQFERKFPGSLLNAFGYKDISVFMPYKKLWKYYRHFNNQ